MALTNKLTAIADAIRSLTGKTDKMSLDEIADDISNAYTINKHLNYSRTAKNLFERADFSVIPYSVLEQLDTANVTNMTNMFSQCSNLETVPLLNTENVTDMSAMFYKCTNLKVVPLFNTKNVESFGMMFYECANLETVPLFNTENATSFQSMFLRCSSLETVPVFNTPNVTIFSHTCNGCGRLKEIPFNETRSATMLISTFQDCVSLSVIPKLDTRNVLYFNNVVTGATNLTEIGFCNIMSNLQVASGTSYGHLLTVDSLLHLIQELRETASLKTLTIGSANLAKLTDVYVRTIEITDEMRVQDDLIDEKYPYELCESTDEGALNVHDYAALKNWQIQ